MAKNYKKIYLKLKKDIQKQINLYETYCSPLTRNNFTEQVELQETINTLKHTILTMSELEGKSCHGIQFNYDQFESWRKNINK